MIVADIKICGCFVRGAGAESIHRKEERRVCPEYLCSLQGVKASAGSLFQSWRRGYSICNKIWEEEWSWFT